MSNNTCLKGSAIIALFFVIAAGVRAGEGYAAGDRVLVIRESPLRIELDTVHAVRAGAVLEVQSINGKWLWVRNDSRSGWLDSADVIDESRGISYFTKKIRSAPKDAGAYDVRAGLWKRKGELDIALGDYNEAIRLAPKNATIWNNRGTLWIAKGEYEKAVSDFSESLRLDPKYSIAWHNRGFTRRATGDNQQAIEDHSEAIHLQPKKALYWYGRARTWLAMDSLEKAIHDCSEALKLDPRFIHGWACRAEIWLTTGQFGRALEDCNELIRLAPHLGGAWHCRGTAWLSKGDVGNALSDYKKATQLDPDDVESRFMYLLTRGIAHVRNSRSDEAIEAVSEAIRVAPDNTLMPVALKIRGDARVLQGEMEEAIEDYSESIQLAPTDPATSATLHDRGEARRKTGDWRGAVSDYQEAVNRDPHAVDSHAALAWLLAACPEAEVRDGSRAIDSAHTAVDLSNGQNARHLEALAAAFAEADDFEQAVTIQKKAIQQAEQGNSLTGARKRLRLYKSGRAWRYSMNSVDGSA